MKYFFVHILLITVVSFYVEGESIECYNCTTMYSQNCSDDQLLSSEEIVQCTGVCITWVINYSEVLHVERGCVSYSPQLNQTLDLSCEFVRQTLYSHGGSLDVCATCHAPFCNSRSAIKMEEESVTSLGNKCDVIAAILVSCVVMLVMGPLS